MTEYMYLGLTVTGLDEEITRFQQAVRGQDENGQEIIIDFIQLILIEILKNSAGMLGGPI